MGPLDTNTVKVYSLDLQDRICTAIEREDAKEIPRGHLATRRGRRAFARARRRRGVRAGGVNFRTWPGIDLPVSATAQRPELAGRSFQALGVSLVIHPRNPYAPTRTRMCGFSWRKPQTRHPLSAALASIPSARKTGAEPVWWFGGGFDSTPYYGSEEDCVHWHQTAKAACEPFGTDCYPRFKKWCDEYFFLKHRQEPRGIGGLFLTT